MLSSTFNGQDFSIPLKKNKRKIHRKVRPYIQLFICNSIQFSAKFIYIKCSTCSICQMCPEGVLGIFYSSQSIDPHQCTLTFAGRPSRLNILKHSTLHIAGQTAETMLVSSLAKSKHEQQQCAPSLSQAVFCLCVPAIQKVV